MKLSGAPGPSSTRFTAEARSPAVAATENRKTMSRCGKGDGREDRDDERPSVKRCATKHQVALTESAGRRATAVRCGRREGACRFTAEASCCEKRIRHAARR